MSEYCQRKRCSTRIARSFQVTTKQCGRCLRVYGRWSPALDVQACSSIALTK